MTKTIESVKTGDKFIAKKNGKTYKVQGFYSDSQPMTSDRPFTAWVLGNNGEWVRKYRNFRLNEVKTWL